MRRLATGLLTVLLLVVAAPVRADAPPSPPAQPDECDWVSFRNSPRNTGATACEGLGTANVPTLAPRFLYRTRDSVSATPAVVDGVLYVGAWDGWFYAFDTSSAGVGDPSLEGSGVTTVEPMWARQIDDPSRVAFGRIVSSPAVVDAAGTRIVLFGGGATVYALDAANGDVLAQICLDPREGGDCRASEHTIEVESSPVAVVEDDGSVSVVVGMDVHNRADVGRTGVVKLRLSPGGAGGWAFQPEWKFDPEAGVAYTGDGLLTRGSGTGGGCGGVWGTAAVDVERGVVVFGTASCSPGRDPQFLDGGEKVFAVSYEDGSPVWRFDPPRPWGPHVDDDFGAAVQLFDVGDRLVAGAPGKDGWYYALDAVTGALVWASQVGQPGHLREGFAIGGIIGSPALGRIGDRQAIFVTTAISTPIAAPLDGGGLDSVDTGPVQDPGRMLSLHALDAATGEVVWRQPLTRQSYGHPTYANGVVFVPSTAGFSVQAFHADTGAPLWSSPPLNGPPSSGVAVTAGAIYVGAGTRQTDAGFKLVEDDSLFGDALGSDPQERLAGIWAFATPG